MKTLKGAVLNALLLCCGLLHGHATAKEIKVNPNQSIQAAIDSAEPGDQVTVARGTYAELLTITKDGIQLVGQDGATLVPPSGTVASSNICAGLAGPNTVAGICVSGSGIQLADFVSEHRKVLSVGTYVQDVLVKGFTVRDFKGLNIAVVGADSAVVHENTVLDGSPYGILSVGSRGSLVTRNAVSSSSLDFIAICADNKDKPGGCGTSVTQNAIADYKVGLCAQTDGGDYSHNTLSGCCVGAYVDPGVTGAHVTHNHISGAGTNPRCFSEFIAAGIVLDGAVSTDVQHNVIEDVTHEGVDLPYPPPGIWLANFEGQDVVGSTIDFNDLRGNDYNVLITSNGTKNEIRHNTCSPMTANCNY